MGGWWKWQALWTWDCCTVELAIISWGRCSGWHWCEIGWAHRAGSRPWMCCPRCWQSMHWMRCTCPMAQSLPFPCLAWALPFNANRQPLLHRLSICRDCHPLAMLLLSSLHLSYLLVSKLNFIVDFMCHLNSPALPLLCLFCLLTSLWYSHSSTTHMTIIMAYLLILYIMELWYLWQYYYYYYLC